MPSPRSWNRREFTVAPNGFFTILKPTGWFSALPLPGGFRYLKGKSKRAVSPPAYENPAGGHAAAMPLQFTSLSTPHPHLMRLAAIVVAAAAITFGLLWWIARP